MLACRLACRFVARHGCRALLLVLTPVATLAELEDAAVAAALLAISWAPRAPLRRRAGGSLLMCFKFVVIFTPVLVVLTSAFFLEVLGFDFERLREVRFQLGAFSLRAASALNSS